MSFATNDERTAKRVSDALGTATEMKAQRNYAGHRLSPLLGHLMVSRQETARPLLTPGEVMQLPPADEIVLVSGLHPIRAKKVRYYEDRQLKLRILPPPSASSADPGKNKGRLDDDWSALPLPSGPKTPVGGGLAGSAAKEDPANAGVRREPELPEHEAIAREKAAPVREFEFGEEDREEDDTALKARVIRRQFGSVARQASLDPDDGIAL